MKALAFISDNCERKLTIDEVADEIFVSPSSVRALLRSETGMGFKEYHTLSRIRRARMALRESSLSMGELAASLGFRDASHFSKTFRKVVGKTPTQYREQALQPSVVCGG